VFAAAKQHDVTATSPAGAADHLRILIVEDDRVIGFLLSEMLTDLGHEVCGIERSENGAVDAAFRVMPDLMIVDAQLAGGTGAGVMARILSRRSMPHLFMSGLPMTNLAGGVVSLLKPFSEDALEQGIQHSVAGWHRGGTRPPLLQRPSESN